MVSWFRAFRGAIATVLWSIIWFLLGLVVISLGVYGSFRIGPYGPEYNLPLLIIALTIGYLIIMFGYIASIYKVQSEIVAEEVEKRLSNFIKRGVRTCSSCGAENPIEAKFCIICGKQL
jgi:ribosomal protein L40E